jgi:hypothetical protein
MKGMAHYVAHTRETGTVFKMFGGNPEEKIIFRRPNRK